MGESVQRKRGKKNWLGPEKKEKGKTSGTERASKEKGAVYGGREREGSRSCLLVKRHATFLRGIEGKRTINPGRKVGELMRPEKSGFQLVEGKRGNFDPFFFGFSLGN